MLAKQPVFKSEVVFLDGHPAVLQWKQLAGRQSHVSSIEKLSSLKDGWSSIYRLNGAGPGGRAVVAKRASRRRLLIERTIYEKILPYVPVRCLHYYGFIEEHEGDFCWLFLEEALGSLYAEAIKLHRTLASTWMGIMHATTAQLEPLAVFPRIGCEHYMSFLDLGQETITQHLSHPALATGEVAMLKKIIGPGAGTA